LADALPRRLAWCAAVWAIVCVDAAGQTLPVTPSVRLQTTWTDNVDLAPSDRKHSDFIVEVVPGVNVDANGRRLKLHLNYAGDLIYYTEARRITSS